MAEGVLAEAVDRIVREARLPTTAAREALRRELCSHFEGANESPEAAEDALARFGDVSEVARGFRQVYRLEFLWSRVLGFVVAVAVSASIGAVTLFLVDLLSAQDLSWPALLKAVGFGIRAGTALAIAWEIGRKPFALHRVAWALAAYCAVSLPVQLALKGGLEGWRPWNIPVLVAIGFLAGRVQHRHWRLVVMFLGFAAHSLVTSPPTIAPRIVAGAVFLLVWVFAEALFARLDWAVSARFSVPMDTAFKTVSR